jgi:hypothetical protein
MYTMNLMKRIIVMSLLAVMLAACPTDDSGKEPGNQDESKFHVYLCFGQSNMEGARPNESAIPQEYKEWDDDRFQVLAAVDMSVNHNWTKGNWYTAVPPLVRQWNGLSPADFFGRTLVEGISDPEVKIGVIVVAVGGAAINMFDKDNTEAMAYLDKQEQYMKDIAEEYGNNPYQRLVDLAKQAQNEGGVIKGILMHQGESGKAKAPSYGNGTDNDNWGTAVKGVYDNLLADLGMKPNSIPLLAGQVYGNNSSIINGLPSVMPGVAHVISSEDLPQGDDEWHFSYEGYKALGTRYGQKMLELNY